ncbi:MAG: Fic family protein [Bacteriovoracales bacterium]
MSEISQLLGNLQVISIASPNLKLRRKNRIKTIKSSLAIEGNTLGEEQITEILENKRVIGTKKEILEVQNALALYEEMEKLKGDSQADFLKAHLTLMKNLVKTAGAFRKTNVGVLLGTKVKHLAPGPKLIPELMENLFKWIKKEKELHPLILSSIVHYEIEFIHPFEDGNGRMGRFWQSLILSKYSDIFRFVPVESLIEKKQKTYYEVLESCDKNGDSTDFIEFMLPLIKKSLEDYSSDLGGVVISSKDRLNHAKRHFEKKMFSRKEYLGLFQSISMATASRDLKEGVDLSILAKRGEKNQTKYYFNQKPSIKIEKIKD